MAKCKYCGKKYDSEEAEELFALATALSYNNLRIHLCGECAISAIESMDDGVYFETCEKCGKTFDVMEESSEFDRAFSGENGVTLMDCWRDYILCCDCAIDFLDELAEMQEEY